MQYEQKSYKYLYYLLMGFNLLTVIIYLSNPFLVNSGYHGLTLLYICVNLIFLGWGFKRGLVKGGSTKAFPQKSLLSDVSHQTLKIYILFYLLTFPLKYAYELHCPPFNIVALVKRIALGIMNPYLGYTTGGLYRPFSWSIYMFICVFDGIFFIVGMLSWKKLRRGEKKLFFILSIIEFLKGLGAGSSFGEIKMITTLAVVLLVNMKEERITRKQKNTIIYSVLGGFFLALFVFGHNMTGRAGGELSSSIGDALDYNQDSFISKYFISFLPTSLQYLYVYISNYLVQGYYNLEYTFTVDYNWTFFLGSNDAKSQLFNVIFGFDVEPLNYQTKLLAKYNIDPYIKWHSCYTWLANDVTLMGVPFLMYYIGKLTGTSLVIYRRYHDLLSGIICVIFSNMIIFLFANNNYIAQLFFTFIFIFPYWYFTRYKCLSV